MKYFQLLFALSICNLLHSQTHKDYILPTEYEMVKEIVGDLDKDGINEIVVLANTNIKLSGISNRNLKRQILIYKKKNLDYSLWKTSGNFLISSQEGFYPDDNHVEISLKNSVIKIVQKYFLNSKTTETDQFTFRFQNNDLFLIGSRIYFERNCEGEILNEVNFSTGKIIVKEEYEDCDEDPKSVKNNFYKEFIHKFTKLIKFTDFVGGQHSIKVPNTEKTIIY